jgi:hypothetical protein
VTPLTRDQIDRGKACYAVIFAILSLCFMNPSVFDWRSVVSLICAVIAIGLYFAPFNDNASADQDADIKSN